MKKITVPILNMVLAAGVLLILAGLLLISYFSTEFTAGIPVWSIATMIVGAVIFYLALTVFSMAVFFFLGLLVFFLGLCMTFVFTNVLPFGPEHLWPVAVLLCGICLILTCVFKHHRIRGVYLVPSVLIETLGVIFLLFSMNVITISLSVFVAKWLPLIFILFGAALVGVFMWQRNFNNYFPYDKDELSDLTDEKNFYGE
ncbi:MAG: hypothetical protein IJ558_09250 [Treponema sp.]|nr:hypothetical protein [Treponema sp.]